VKLLLDTHFLIWILMESKRLEKFPWLDRYRPWGISPISLLEIQFLAEAGRLEVRNPELTERVSGDPRFVVDEVPTVALVRHALGLGWTLDPFDRLLVAHSAARRTPLATVDGTISQHHGLLARELAGLR
jgi:PIN domain nuclease of toxin-antitoxin system